MHPAGEHEFLKATMSIKTIAEVGEVMPHSRTAKVAYLAGGALPRIVQ
jgi:hypothetical protein